MSIQNDKPTTTPRERLQRKADGVEAQKNVRQFTYNISGKAQKWANADDLKSTIEDILRTWLLPVDVQGLNIEVNELKKGQQATVWGEFEATEKEMAELDGQLFRAKYDKKEKVVKLVHALEEAPTNEEVKDSGPSAEYVARWGEYVETVKQWGETFKVYRLGNDYYGITPGQTWVAKFNVESD